MPGTTSQNQTQIMVACSGGIVQIRVLGRATFLNGQPLRDFGLKILQSELSKVLIDLSQCISMDSTFMGVLAMIALRVRKKNIPIEIVNADKEKKRLLTSLGLGNLFDFTRTATEDVDWVSLCNTKTDKQAPSNTLENAKTMLEAHEVLMEVSEDNIPRFRNVVEYLKQDIDSMTTQ